jgi:hypothetical protein
MDTNAHIGSRALPCEHHGMHIQTSTALIVVALVSSVVLLLEKSERTISLVALIAAGIDALLAFGLMSLSLARFRIDVMLPGLLVVCGVIAWARSSSKSAITAATLLTVVGGLQLGGVLHMLG